MTVNILLTIDPAHVKSCILTLDSVRVGFPSAAVEVTLNHPTERWLYDIVTAKVGELGGTLDHARRLHHANWIRDVLDNSDGGEPCIILDGDMVFWENCENWEIDGLIAGYYTPLIYNDFAQCVSFPRLHTSFLWIPDTRKLLGALRNCYPNSHGPHGDYCPADPFMPRVGFIRGVPMFWDSCSTLYNMVGGTHFTREQLDCYEHLNSASFYDVMYERLTNKTGFELLHSYYVDHPAELKGFSRQVDDYYQTKHRQALDILRKIDVRGEKESILAWTGR